MAYSRNSQALSLVLNSCRRRWFYLCVSPFGGGGGRFGQTRDTNKYSKQRFFPLRPQGFLGVYHFLRLFQRSIKCRALHADTHASRLSTEAVLLPRVLGGVETAILKLVRAVFLPRVCVFDWFLPSFRAGGGTTSVRRGRGGDSDIEGGLPQPHGKDGLRQEVGSVPFFFHFCFPFPFPFLTSSPVLFFPSLFSSFFPVRPRVLLYSVLCTMHS